MPSKKKDNLKDSARSKSDNTSYFNQSLDEEYILNHPLEVAPTREQYKKIQKRKKGCVIIHHSHKL